MTGAPRIDRYRWRGGEEAMLRFGPDDGFVVVLALPLFQEANRARAFGVAILRHLAERGIAGVLPDMPGQGESLVPLHSLSLLRMAEGYEGLIDGLRAQGRKPYAAGIRSGALLDGLGLVHGRWYLAPQDGRDLLRELTRIKQASSATRLPDRWFLDPLLFDDRDDPAVEIAGNRIGTALLTDLCVHEAWRQERGGPVRVVRLDGDPRAADRHVEGAPLWRRSEPGNDPDLAALLAEDIARWVGRCAG